MDGALKLVGSKICYERPSVLSILGIGVKGN